MDPGGEDPREIARKLEQATRMVSGVSESHDLREAEGLDYRTQGEPSSATRGS